MEGKGDCFDWKPTAGNVVLRLEVTEDTEVGGMIKAHSKRNPIDIGTIVALGDADIFEIDKLLKVGAKFMLPVTAKKEFKKDGQTYYIIHHRELQLCIG